MKKTLLIIPARKNSKRLRSKNFLKLGELPLIEHTISKFSQLDNSKYKIIVSSDDPRAQTISKRYKNVQFIKRPESISSDESPASDYVKHAISFINIEDFENILILQPTSPFTRIEDVTESLNLFDKSRFKSLASVVEIDHDLHPEKFKTINKTGELKSFFSIQDNFQRSKMEKVFVRNGSIYLTTIENFFESNKIITDPCQAYIMRKEFSIDINTQIDFYLAEIILKNQKL